MNFSILPDVPIYEIIRFSISQVLSYWELLAPLFGTTRCRKTKIPFGESARIY